MELCLYTLLAAHSCNMHFKTGYADRIKLSCVGWFICRVFQEDVDMLRRTFLRLNDVDITINTYIGS
jgi:hypothetical protein